MTFAAAASSVVSVTAYVKSLFEIMQVADGYSDQRAAGKRPCDAMVSSESEFLTEVCNVYRKGEFDKIPKS